VLMGVSAPGLIAQAGFSRAVLQVHPGGRAARWSQSRYGKGRDSLGLYRGTGETAGDTGEV